MVKREKHVERTIENIYLKLNLTIIRNLEFYNDFSGWFVGIPRIPLSEMFVYYFNLHVSFNIVFIFSYISHYYVVSVVTFSLIFNKISLFLWLLQRWLLGNAWKRSSLSRNNSCLWQLFQIQGDLSDRFHPFFLLFGLTKILSSFSEKNVRMLLRFSSFLKYTVKRTLQARAWLSGA